MLARICIFKEIWSEPINPSDSLALKKLVLKDLQFQMDMQTNPAITKAFTEVTAIPMVLLSTIAVTIPTYGLVLLVAQLLITGTGIGIMQVSTVIGTIRLTASQ